MTSLSIEPERSTSHGDDKDFAVFGVPRLPAFERPDYDPVPRLGGARVAVDMATRLPLLGEDLRDMAGGRVALNI